MTDLAHREVETTPDMLLECATAWRYLHDLFHGPGPEQWRWLQSESAQAAWRLLAQWTGLENCATLPLANSYESYAGEYVAAFEVGLPEPPCPLIESHWNKRDPVPKVLHENMLFYKQFGLELRSSSNETADHLRHQLEFVHHLYRMEREAVIGNRLEHADQCARARIDYLNRHLGFWVPRAYLALDKKMPGSWCAQWMYLLSLFCQEFCTER